MLGIDPLDPSVTEALNSLRMQTSAGVSLARSLQTAAPVCKHMRAKHAFQAASATVSKGGSFEQALESLAHVLSYAEQTILAAGWESGRIEWAMLAVIERRREFYKLRRNIRSQLIMPGLQFIAACFIIPFPKFFLGGGDGYFTAALTPLIAVFGIYLLVRLFQRAAARQWSHRKLDAPPPPAMPWDNLVLQIPVLRFVTRWRNLSEFAALMSNLLGAGLSMLHALKVCSKTLPNGIYRAEVMECRRKIEKEGGSLSETLRGPLWPHDWIAVMDVGYQSGEEEKVLRRLGESGQEQYLAAVTLAARAFTISVRVAIMVYIGWQVISMYQSIMGGAASQLFE